MQVCGHGGVACVCIILIFWPALKDLRAEEIPRRGERNNAMCSLWSLCLSYIEGSNDSFSEETITPLVFLTDRTCSGFIEVLFFSLSFHLSFSTFCPMCLS